MLRQRSGWLCCIAQIKTMIECTVCTTLLWSQLVLFGNMMYGVHIMQALPVKAALGAGICQPVATTKKCCGCSRFNFATVSN